MTTLNKIGFWGWLFCIISGILFHIKSCVMDMNFLEGSLAYQEFWIGYIFFVIIFLYLWFRDWSRPGMFDFRKF